MAYYRVTVLHPMPTPPYGIEHLELKALNPQEAEAQIRALRPTCAIMAVEFLRW